MNCRHIQAELSAYMDNEVSTATRALVEEHVRGCRPCRERLAELKTLTAGVTALPRLQPAPQFLAEVRRQIARDGKSPPKVWQDYLFRPFWLKVPIEAVAAAVVVALVMRFELSGKEGGSGHDKAAATVHLEKAASAPTAAEGESHLIDKLVPSRPVGSATPPISTTRLPQQPTTELVVVHAKDFNNARSRVQEVAVAMNGRVVLPSDRKTPAQTLFVELPQESVAAFKSHLLQTVEHTGAQAQDQLAAEPKEIGKKAATTILEIQIVPD
jgi:Putative zinc-finger